MRFDAIFPVKVSFQQLSLRGPCLRGQEEQCHEFTVGEKTYYSCNESTLGDRNFYYSPAVVIVRLVAVNYANENLHGPASSLKDKSIMYPCDRFKCRVSCPCRLCKVKLPYCNGAKDNKTCGDCSDCRQDYQDHLIFHRVLHIQCKFCHNVFEHIPNMNFVICGLKGYWPDIYEVRTCAYILSHYHSIPGMPDLDNSSSKYSCDKCDKKFTKLSDVKRHEDAMHFGASHSCNLCGMKLSRIDSLKQHMETVHSNKVVARYECSKCDEIFSKKSNYERHLKVIRTCDICSELFCSTKQVQKHKRENHSNSCNYCKKCFQTEEHLKRHQNVALKPDGTFKHYCVPCEVRCCTLQDLQRHMNSHEKDPIKCEYCNNAFSTKWRLKAHKDSRKEAICSKCGKILCNEQNLKVHINSAHNTRKCELCNKVYCLENYKWHMYSVHQKLAE